MASKQHRLLATLEDAFPVALDVDDLAKITRMSREDVETLLSELRDCQMASQLDDGLWMRAQVQQDGSTGRHTPSNKLASTTDARRHGTFSMIEHVFLVGVAGGVACFDDDTRHVRRGDVIVSKPAQLGGAIYMQIVSRDEDSSQSRLTWAARDPTLSDITSKLLRKPKTFYKTLDQHISNGLSELDDAAEQGGPATGRLASFRRPPPDTDRLYQRSGKTETLVEHPPVTPDSRRDQRPEKPLVHMGVVATGAVSDHQQRQCYLDEHDVRAFDSGFQAVMESVEGNRKDSFIVVRGVCDYDDGTTADKGRRDEADWRPYCALAAAGVMKSIVLAIVTPSDDDDDDND